MASANSWRREEASRVNELLDRITWRYNQENSTPLAAWDSANFSPLSLISDLGFINLTGNAMEEGRRIEKMYNKPQSSTVTTYALACKDLGVASITSPSPSARMAGVASQQSGNAEEKICYPSMGDIANSIMDLVWSFFMLNVISRIFFGPQAYIETSKSDILALFLWMVRSELNGCCSGSRSPQRKFICMVYPWAVMYCYFIYEVILRLGETAGSGSGASGSASNSTVL